ncbi:MAG: UDP-N-acetylmuramoyl-tripeptide--D-alanyl-D-alanine ligase [Nitrospirae bacterium]|nr:UDP-N-acetylmuramoyl-tripeptide--D-alanyl-D-alanine ligase [Nitrospirota bacterium]
MEMMRVEEILEAAKGRLLKGDGQLAVPGISIDSRTVKAGEMFLALKGERFDGHDFVEEAFQRGARGAIVSDDFRVLPLYPYGHRRAQADSGLQVIVRVPDTLKALQDIAGCYRNKFDIPLVVITGTNGKTTTKDMVAAILGRQLAVLKAEGSFNNEVGVPLTLLRLSPSHQAAVLEVGMNAPGEIAYLTQLIKPQVGVITNIGRAHLEFFQDIEEVARAKAELVETLGNENTLVLNRDDQRVWALSKRIKGRLISFGIEEEADFRAGQVEYLPDGKTKFILSTLEGKGERLEVELPIPGHANIYNALAAVAISATFDLDLNLIKEGLESFKPSSQRMEVISLSLKRLSSKIKIINDTYNANPESMKMALGLLSHLQVGGRKVAVLGDMLELGEWGEEAHREVGRLVTSCSPDILITVGSLSRVLAEEAKKEGLEGEIFTFRDSREAGKELAEMIKEDDTILVKGSRAMRMEEIIDVLLSLS